MHLELYLQSDMYTIYLSVPVCCTRKGEFLRKQIRREGFGLKLKLRSKLNRLSERRLVAFLVCAFCLPIEKPVQSEAQLIIYIGST